MVEAGLDLDRRKVLPGRQLQVDVVVTDQKLRVVGDDPEVEEELTPGVVALRGSHEDDGDIMAKVVNAPEKDPVGVMMSDVEVLAVKGKRR